MTDPPPDRCGYQWPEDADVELPDHILRPHHCCWRNTWADFDRCIWHAETDAEKPFEELECRRETPENRELNRGGGYLAELLERSYLSELLDGAHLSGVDLRARHSGLDLWVGGPFEACSLRGTDLADANLRGADLIRADLPNADLIRAFFHKADLTDANLRGADLTGVDLTEAVLEGIRVNGATRAGKTRRMALRDRIPLLKGHRRDQIPLLKGGHRAESLAMDPSDWDAVARSYHNLKVAFSDHGLVGKARDMHFLERRARGLESKAASERLNGWVTPGYLGSLASRWLTGYGVRVGRLALVMLLLLVGGALWYANGEIDDSVYYSVHTFTTNPPDDPPEGERVTRWIAMIQTFFGTVLVVLLGYVLGNREQV